MVATGAVLTPVIAVAAVAGIAVTNTPGTGTPAVGTKLAGFKNTANLNSSFGASVDISGTTAIVGEIAGGLGRAYVFTHTTRGWAASAALKGADTSSNDLFGSSVAISGTTAVVSAPFHGANHAKDLQSGRAYVFSKTTKGWKQIAELKGSDTGRGSGFGLSVAISGSTIVVSSSGAGPSTPLGGGTGRVYVFTKTRKGWRQAAEFHPSDARESASLGVDVAVSGTTVVAGAQLRAKGGRTYVFVKTTKGWKQTAELKGSDTVAGDSFGTGVAVSGSTIIIGASSHAGNNGRAYLFSKTTKGWKQTGEIGGSNGELFGASVGISGTTAVIGAINYGAPSDGSGPGIGRAYVFTKTVTGWKRSAALNVAATGGDEEVGWSVAVSGTTAIVGNVFDGAYIFRS
jgi:hypothetical protein